MQGSSEPARSPSFCTIITANHTVSLTKAKYKIQPVQDWKMCWAYDDQSLYCKIDSMVSQRDISEQHLCVWESCYAIGCHLNFPFFVDKYQTYQTYLKFCPGPANPDKGLQHRRGAAVLWQDQHNLPQEGQEPQRRVEVTPSPFPIHFILTCRLGPQAVTKFARKIYAKNHVLLK